ncbi:MAG: hypothetical protein ACRETG_08075, partial [Steroidobacteraceae bacterium]
MRHTTVVLTAVLWACALTGAAARTATNAPGAPPAPSATAAPAAAGPTEVVTTAAQGMLGDLDRDRDRYRRDPAKVGE